jgi:hypothetical protein
MNKINFLVTDYIVAKNEHSNKLTLNGQKLPRPSKRITTVEIEYSGELNEESLKSQRRN